MCDVAKLRGKITEKGMTQEKLSKEVCMDRSTLNRKLKTGESFTVGEANRIARALNLSKDEALDIFFTEVVA